MQQRAIAIASLLTAALALPTVAHADTSGPEGRAKSIDILSPSSDSYGVYHGRIFVVAQKRTEEYRWGGSSCGTKVLSENQVNLLVEAVRNRDSIKITPVYKSGQGGTKCLVGFGLREKERKTP